MGRFLRWPLRIAGFLFLVLAGVLLFGPRDAVSTGIRFDPNGLTDNLDGYLSQREAVFSNITPGTGKRIVWAGAPGEKTPLSLIYLHGFSATAEEIRPLPDDVAAGLGANLYFARLAGHGRDGADLAGATAEDWILDLDEALAIGRRIGERVLVIGTSTGGTLAVLAALDPARSQGLAGVVLISPNFRLAPLAARLLDLPFARIWGPLVAGPERSFAPVNEAHARYWTTRYPTVALFPMAALTRAVRAMDVTQTRIPALFVFSPDDRVVDASLTARIAEAWGGDATIHQPELTAADDPYAHVVAGRILSPDQTVPLTGVILDWASGL